MFRTDPFFTTHPQRRNYLESLYRTYSVPPSALPKRDNEEFVRALQHRNQEKAYWKRVEEERDALKQELKVLGTEQQKMHELFDKLSKSLANGTPTSSRGADSSVPDRSTNDDNVSTEQAKGSVPAEVLLRGDVGGQGDEHGAEGPEPGSGSGEAPETTGVAERGEETV
jgi:hypothetical protein|tara:strand:+ start:5716 stop:6222 length:507 start_codon:yes stop_codon:yes gene_type:complete